MVRSSRADPTVGLMDGAYFTSRKEIIIFFNKLLHMSLTKIEQMATGAVACQLMDYIFPGSVPMKRVNWEAKSDFQYVENYKLLQAAFTKHNVQKYVDVDRLIRGKYQDNLEFCQWFKAFFEHVTVGPREDYDPVTRRVIGKGGKYLEPHFCPQSGDYTYPQNTSILSRRGNGYKSSVSFSSTHQEPSKNTTVTSYRSSVLANRTRTDKNRKTRVLPSQKSQVKDPETEVIDTILMKKNSELLRRNAELVLMLEGMEKERDFYFEKLRGIEIMLQVHEENLGSSDVNEVMVKIFRVLYAKSEENVVVSNYGEACSRVY